jgi:hypothetical protein
MFKRLIDKVKAFSDRIETFLINDWNKMINKAKADEIKVKENVFNKVNNEVK